MDGRTLEQRVGELEREVAALRARLDAAEREPSSALATPVGSSASAPVVAPIARTDSGVLPATPRAPERAVEVASAEPEPPPLAPAQLQAAREFSDYGAHTAREPRPPEATLERRIGGQVFAVAGALIVVIGLALAVKVAIDYGWFGAIPPGLRCLGIAGVGAAFLVAGELLRTRVRSIAVAGFNAAGVGGLYVSAYAAYGVFHLVSAPVAFALMAGAAGVGLVVALRHGFLSTAVLSLIGAYLVPPFVAQADASPYVLPVYLLLLSAVALSLAAWRPRPFGPTRDVAWVGTGALGLIWTVLQAEHIVGFVLVFWGAAWAMHQAELLVTAARGELWRRDEAGVGPRTGLWRRRVEPLFLAVATTAAVVGIGTLLLEHHTAVEPWLAPAALFTATSLVALAFGGHMRVLRDKPRTDLETLAAAHAAQSGALLVVAVALALGGWIEVTAWLGMGVAAVLAGRWTGARSLQFYGITLLVIASGRLGLYDIAFGPASVPWTIAGGVAIAPWTALVVGAGASWMLAALLMLVSVRDEDDAVAIAPRPGAGAACAAIGAGAWMHGAWHPQSNAVSVCLVWLALSLAYRGAARIRPALRLDAVASLCAAGAIVPWVVGLPPDQWLRDSAPPLAFPGLWLGGAVSLVLALHAWATRRRASGEAALAWPIIAALAGAVAFAATSIEVARSAAIVAQDVTARRAALSIWWGLWGVGLVVGGFAGRASPVRYVGLVLIAVAAAKAVLLDLAGVPPLWRVASFVGLGGLMLGVAVLYGRVSASLGADGQAPEGGRPA